MWQEQRGAEQVIPDLLIPCIDSAQAKAAAVQSVFVPDRKSFTI
jgi:hypothetical protein